MDASNAIFQQSLVILYPCFSVWVLMLFYQVFTGHVPGWAWQRCLFAMHFLTLLASIIITFSGWPLSGRLWAFGYGAAILFALLVPLSLGFFLYWLIRRTALPKPAEAFRIRDYHMPISCGVVTFAMIIFSSINP